MRDERHRSGKRSQEEMKGLEVTIKSLVLNVKDMEVLKEYSWKGDVICFLF